MAAPVALLDVNVLIALLDSQHVHHEPAYPQHPRYPNSPGGPAAVMPSCRRSCSSITAQSPTPICLPLPCTRGLAWG